MTHTSKPIRILLGMLALVVLIITLGMVSGALPSLGEWKFFISPLAPPPSPEAIGGFQTSPLGTSIPLPETLRATPVPIVTVRPTVPPPPGWPTEVPWPLTPEPPIPTATPRPFPTPAFPPLRGKRPATLQTIWFPYYPAPGIAPQMRAVLVDQQGQRWVESDRVFDLDLPAPNLHSVDPGPILTDLHLSPDNQWLVADFAYTGSRLVDLSSGEVVQLPAMDSPTDKWHFLAWHPDGQHILALAREGILLNNLVSHRYETLDYYSQPEFEYAQVCALAYSPRDTRLADGIVYPAVYEVRDVEIAEVGLISPGDEREPIVRIPGGTYVLDHSLKWSPDGQRLIWIVNVVPDGAGPVRLENMQTQLWLADLSEGDVKMLTILGEAVEYKYPAVWSPDGHNIAALIVEEVQDDEIVGNNIFLLDPQTGTKQQVTHFVNWQLSHLTWSPDGQWIAFTVSKGEYGEIWVTNLDGTWQYPVAGPTLPNAPFVWLSARGGK